MKTLLIAVALAVAVAVPGHADGLLVPPPPNTGLPPQPRSGTADAILYRDRHPARLPDGLRPCRQCRCGSMSLLRASALPAAATTAAARWVDQMTRELVAVLAGFN